jgi:hypothetical protein
MANIISRTYQKARNYLLPTMGGVNVKVPPDQGKPQRNLRNYISPVQLARIVTDVKTLTDAINESENAWYPQRVKLQQLFLTTVRNGHVDACMDRRLKLTMLKDYQVVDKSGKVNKEATAMLKVPWFRNLMKYALEAKAFGYSLIALNDMINSAFPGLTVIRRYNISPDRLNVTQYIYQISGAPFLEEPYKDWHIWVPTPSDLGVSLCGYGYLYKVALYEIFCRNTLAQNSTAAELFGMPLRVGKTNKTEEPERGEYENALANMGAAGYILLDMLDELELVESKGLGQGYKIYESLEQRCEKKISKIILGHADALDSTPGQLGGAQNEESPAATAMRDVATTDMNDFVDLCTNEIFPKFVKLGLSIFEGQVFQFSNNDELAETRAKEDDANDKTADVFVKIKQAGGDPDWAYFTKRTGIPVKAAATVIPITNPAKTLDDKSKPFKSNDRIKNKLEALYGT